ncbi:MAG: TIGR02281 family clan AA aspartic protease [Fimbriimonas sp.]
MLIAALLVSDSTTIPFKMIKEGMPLIEVQASLGGQENLHFILDTGNGAAPIIISTALSKRIAFQSDPTKKPNAPFGVGKQGLLPMNLGIVKNFRLGNLTTASLEAGAGGSLDRLGGQLGVTIDGNIGYGFLKDFALRIDYRTSKLSLTRSPKAQAGVPFTVGLKPLIVVDTKVNGKPCLMVLDTGAGGSVLSEQFAKDAGLELGHPVHLMGAAGTETGHMAQLETLSIGDSQVKNLHVVTAGFLEELAKKVGKPVQGIVGADFLSKFDVTIDYPNGILTLKKPSA